MTPKSRDAIGQFDPVGKRVMGEHRRADLGFIQANPEALKECVVVVETGINFLNGAEDSALVRLGWIASARPRFVRVQVVSATATEAVV